MLTSVLLLGASLGEIPAEPKTFFQKYGMMAMMIVFNLAVQESVRRECCAPHLTLPLHSK